MWLVNLSTHSSGLNLPSNVADRVGNAGVLGCRDNHLHESVVCLQRLKEDGNKTHEVDNLRG